MDIDPDIYVPSESPEREFIYNNETQELIYQVPLAFTRYNIKRNADELYNDDSSQYFTYSGSWNVTTVSREKDNRYKNISLKAYSGDSFKFYLNVGAVITESGFYLSGPVTTSGVYKTFTAYSGENDAVTNAVTFTAPTDNASVYTMPSVENLRYMRLYHSPITASGTYRIYQFLPRTLIQVDDLEADVIDTVTLRVSDSIVIGPNLIEDKSILGRKIADGTVSGVLITDGTVTGSKIVANTISGALITAGTITGDKITASTISGSLIAANTITANKLSVSQLDAVAGNMGTLVVNSGITVSASGYISAGKTTINASGITIGNLSSTNDVVDSLKIIGSGTVGDIVGIAFFNGAQSPTIPVASLRLDGVNTLEIANEVSSNNASIHMNFNENYTGAFRVINGDIDISRTPSSPSDIAPGAVRGYDSDGTNLYELSADGIYLMSTAGASVYSVATSTGAVTVTGDVAVNTNKVSITASNGNTDIRGNVTVSGSISHRDAGILSRSAGQTVNAGTSARVQLNVAGTGNILGNATTYEVTVTNAGLYIVNAAVTSTTTNLPWNVRQNATSFTTGTQMLPGLTFSDGRQINTTIFYLSANDTVGLFVNNTGGSSASVTGALRVVRLT